MSDIETQDQSRLIDQILARTKNEEESVLGRSGQKGKVDIYVHLIHHQTPIDTAQFRVDLEDDIGVGLRLRLTNVALNNDLRWNSDLLLGDAFDHS